MSRSLRRHLLTVISTALLASVLTPVSAASAATSEISAPTETTDHTDHTDHTETTEHTDAPIEGHGTIADAAAGLDDPARGVIFDELEIADDNSICAGMFEVLVDGRVHSCTPGPSRAPAGLDVTETVPTSRYDGPASAYATEGGTTPIPCIGNGTDGTRTQVLYVVAADRTDRYTTVRDDIVGWTKAVNENFVASAQDHAGVDRHVRFVTVPSGDSCSLVVTRVIIPSWGDDSFGNIIDAVSAAGFNNKEYKYLMFTDAEVYCGIGNVYPDDRASQDNLNNGNEFAAMYARIDTSCWDSSVVPAHELLHTLGAVQSTAPNGTEYFHCSDESDIMCYADGSGVPMRDVCPVDFDFYERYIDCNGDDYFNPAPAAGSWLATHWNTANSRFLSATTGADVPPPPAPTTTTTSTTTTTAPPPPPPISKTAQEKFIDAAYQDFLGRYPTGSETTRWIKNVGSASQRAVMLQTLAYSDEYIGFVVDGYYLNTLGRLADPSGKAHWINVIRAKRSTPGQVAAAFYASDEYYKRLGGNTVESWTTDLYRKLLFRTPDAGGKAYWSSVALKQGRMAVAEPFMRAQETLNVRVNVLYKRFLNRTSDAGGLKYWSGVIGRTGNDVDLAISLVSSDEYYSRAQRR